MSADIDRIGGSMHIIHDIYSSFLDLAVSMLLLYRLIGEAVFAPAVWVLGKCFAFQLRWVVMS